MAVQSDQRYQTLSLHKWIKRCGDVVQNLVHILKICELCAEGDWGMEKEREAYPMVAGGGGEQGGCGGAPAAAAARWASQKREPLREPLRF